ncbi:MAG TPA: sigma-70 family RNA polymerase sigma factor [Kofleriaceae bacterium]
MTLTGLDEEIRALLEAGDVRRATTRALQELGPQVLGFLSGALGDDDADEVFSRLSVRLWKSLAGFQSRCALRTWIYVLARQEIGRYQRRARKHVNGRVPISQLADVLEDVRLRTRTTVVAERQRTVSKLRAELPIEDRTLLILRVDRRLSWDEVALAFVADPETCTEADKKRECARLRKRFQLIRERLVKRAREEAAP